jgi:hypothetical protein
MQDCKEYSASILSPNCFSHHKSFDIPILGDQIVLALPFRVLFDL